MSPPLHLQLWLTSIIRPYYGQASWFLLFTPEKIPSAIVRYQKEIIRVLGVLESVLAKHRWLVGEKYSAADVSFITYVLSAVAHLDLHSSLILLS